MPPDLFVCGSGLSRGTPRTEILAELRFFAMDCPAQRRPLINRIPDVQPRASFNQQLHHLGMARADRLMQGCRMGMEPVGVVAVRIFPRLEQQPDDFSVAVLSG